ncbi:MAG: class I SAM-dependent methyltransferase [Candidatus Omnitrophica bacterium]|nr:class I SAM-dependent methyltransferase [Candidatus Omnitrophota bacterium]
MMLTRNLALHVEPRITKEDSFVLQQLLKNLPTRGIVVEVGSFLGNGSTKTIIDTILYKDVNGTLYCIDTWKGNQNVDWHLKLAEEYSLFDTFLYYVTMYGGQNIVKPMIMESKDAALTFKDKSCDLIFIDGDHSFEITKQDIEMWMPKVKKGGILCGHDCEGAISDFDPVQINKNLDKDFVPLENFLFAGCHPGVVKAVDAIFNGNVTLWAHKDLTEYGISGRSSIWHEVM